MPPIPVHIDAPITPKKATGATPQTQRAPANASDGDNPATTTSTAQQAYTPARPGAAAGPAPTSYVPAPHQTPTRTSGLDQNDGPPAPQPGAVPAPPSSQYTPSRGVGSSVLPPPPKAGEASQQPPPTHPATQLPPPQQNYAPTHSTTTATTASSPQRAGPTTLNMGPAASPAAGAPAPGSQFLAAGTGPPGYTQNAYAQELNSAQRASLDGEAKRGGSLADITSGMGFGGGSGGVFGGSSGGGGGDFNETAGNVWSAVKGWASTAGTKLAETEEEVWRRINGK